MRRLATAMLLAAAACARPAELRVIVDSTAAPGAVEVLATPVDPAALLPRNGARRAADSLDASYQRERLVLNARTAVLDTMDRRTSAYATAYADQMAQIAAAERVRASRDSAARIAGPRQGIGGATMDSAARVAGRPVVRGVLAGGGTTITLTAGGWWVALLDSAGGLLPGVKRIEVMAGGRDTVRVGVGGGRSR
jgi:hypothetical protein